MVGYRAYKGNQIESSTPVGLVVLTYDSIIKHLHLAHHHAVNLDFQHVCEHGARASEGILDLLSSLDHQKGGDLAIKLEQLYAYCLRCVQQGMMESDPDEFMKAIDVMNTLKEAWDDLAHRQQVPSMMQAYG